PRRSSNSAEGFSPGAFQVGRNAPDLRNSRNELFVRRLLVRSRYLRAADRGTRVLDDLVAGHGTIRQPGPEVGAGCDRGVVGGLAPGNTTVGPRLLGNGVGLELRVDSVAEQQQRLGPQLGDT